MSNSGDPPPEDDLSCCLKTSLRQQCHDQSSDVERSFKQVGLHRPSASCIDEWANEATQLPKSYISVGRAQFSFVTTVDRNGLLVN